MRVYLAARYSRREELLAYRVELEADGHTVTSRWLNGQHQLGPSGAPIGDAGEALVEAGDDAAAATLRARFVGEDIGDVLGSDCVVSFTEPSRSANGNRGGRHVEFGIALGINEFCGLQFLTARPPFRLIVVGYRENLFHWRRGVEFHATWAEARDALRGGRQ